MKKIALSTSIGLIVFLCLLASCNKTPPVKVTQLPVERLPEFIAAHNGKIVVIDLWALW